MQNPTNIAWRLKTLSGSSGTFNYAYTPAVTGAYASQLVQGISIPTNPAADTIARDTAASSASSDLQARSGLVPAQMSY